MPDTKSLEDTKEIVATKGTGTGLEMTIEEAQKMPRSYDDAFWKHQKNQRVWRKYRNGSQWTEDEIRKLKKRKQPIITLNVIFKTIEALRGYEIESRRDPEALPRNNRNPTAEIDAEVMTDVLRYIGENNDIDDIRGEVFLDLMTVGHAGVLVPVTTDEKTKERELGAVQIAWDRIIYDPHSSDELMLDAGWTGWRQWMDIDDAVDEFGEQHRDALESALQTPDDGQHADTNPDKPQTVWIDRDRRRLVVTHIFKRHKGQWYAMVFAANHWIEKPRLTGYKDTKGNHVSPLHLVSAYVDDDNGRFGWVKQLISPQDIENKANSKFMHALNTNQIHAEKGAFPDVNKAREEAHKPDGVIIRNPGKEVSIERNTELASGALQMLEVGRQAMAEISPSLPQAANDPGELSGDATEMRAGLGANEIKPLLANMGKLEKRIYYAWWHGVRQFWPEERWMRVTDHRNRPGYKFVAINRQVTKAQVVREMMQRGVPVQQAVAQIAPEAMAPLMGMLQAPQVQQLPPEQIQQMVVSSLDRIPGLDQVMTANDVSQLDVDIVVSSAPDTAVVQEQQFKRLAEMAPAYAQAGQPIPLKVMIKASQLRDKDELIEEIDEAKKGPDPAVAQMQQQMQQMQLQMEQLKVQLLTAEVAKSQADTAKKQAEAERLQAQTNVQIPAEAQRDQASAMSMAAGAGEKLAPAPNDTPSEP